MSFSEWEEFNPQGFSRYWQYRDNQGMPAGRVVEQLPLNGRYDFRAYGRLTSKHAGGGHGKKIVPSLGRFHTLEEAQRAVVESATKGAGATIP